MICISLLVFVTIISITCGRGVDSHSVPITMDSYGNRVFLIRDQRNPTAGYPHRSMMFTGVYEPYYRPSGRQATGIFAQGNAVSSDAYLGANMFKLHRKTPEKFDEPEISSAEAEAFSDSIDIPMIDDKQTNLKSEHEDDEVLDDRHIITQQEEKPTHYSTELPESTEPQVGVEQHPIKPNRPGNKGKKPKIHVEEEEEEDEDEYEDDETLSPFTPFKGNRRGRIPSYNNFFPMVFSFPKTLGRKSPSGSSSIPGMITAIANSYSTGKGGVASSVATAYGGSPNSKKKFKKSYQE